VEERGAVQREDPGAQVIADLRQVLGGGAPGADAIFGGAPDDPPPEHGLRRALPDVGEAIAEYLLEALLHRGDKVRLLRGGLLDKPDLALRWPQLNVAVREDRPRDVGEGRGGRGLPQGGELIDDGHKVLVRQHNVEPLLRQLAVLEHVHLVVGGDPEGVLLRATGLGDRDPEHLRGLPAGGDDVAPHRAEAATVEGEDPERGPPLEEVKGRLRGQEAAIREDPGVPREAG
jgi:hypothetical protein